MTGAISRGLFFGGRGHPVADVVDDRAAEDALVLGRLQRLGAENQRFEGEIIGDHDFFAWQVRVS